MDTETGFIDLAVKTVGEGVDRYESKMVGDIELRRFIGRGDYEWRERDLDIGRQCEYERPRDVRKLIRQFPNDFGICADSARTSPAGRPNQEWWLTEFEALLLVMESRTPKAKEYKEKIARVFLAVKNGELAALQAKLDRVLSWMDTREAEGRHMLAQLGEVSLALRATEEKAERSAVVAIEARRYAAEALDEVADGNEALHGLDTWLRASRSVDGLAGDEFGKWARTMMVEIARTEGPIKGIASEKIWPEVNTKARDVGRLPMGADWSELLEANKGLVSGYLSQRLRRAKAQLARRNGGHPQGRLRFPRKGRR